MEQRIVELELRYTEQQRMLEELSGVVFTQGRELDLLRSRLELLEAKLAAEPGVVDSADRERPPHY